MKTANVQLLISRLEAQLDSPEAARFNMRYFGNRFIPGTTMDSTVGALETPICNTQACLAGETVLATGSGRLISQGGIIVITKGLGGWNIMDQAAKDLGLTKLQSKRLFFLSSMVAPREGRWPKKFEDAYLNAKTPQGRLYVAIRRVEHFLATKGRE